MPFPLDEKYIKATEEELSVIFPPKFKEKMMEDNGGTLSSRRPYVEHIQLYPFFDKSNKKRISRTCNHIGLETKNEKEADYGFPENAVTIGNDGSGNQIILIHNGNNVLEDIVYFWNCKTRKVKKIGSSIYDFENN